MYRLIRCTKKLCLHTISDKKEVGARQAFKVHKRFCILRLDGGGEIIKFVDPEIPSSRRIFPPSGNLFPLQWQKQDRREGVTCRKKMSFKRITEQQDDWRFDRLIDRKTTRPKPTLPWNDPTSAFSDSLEVLNEVKMRQVRKKKRRESFEPSRADWYPPASFSYCIAWFKFEGDLVRPKKIRPLGQEDAWAVFRCWFSMWNQRLIFS